MAKFGDHMSSIKHESYPKMVSFRHPKPKECQVLWVHLGTWSNMEKAGSCIFIAMLSPFTNILLHPDTSNMSTLICSGNLEDLDTFSHDWAMFSWRLPALGRSWTPPWNIGCSAIGFTGPFWGGGKRRPAAPKGRQRLIQAGRWSMECVFCLEKCF